MNTSDRNRESIWSIPAGWGTVYFMAFSLSNLVAICVIVADETINRGDAIPLKVFSAIVERVAVTGVAFAITIFSVAEAIASTVITANYIRQKWLEPLKERQRAEGREQGLKEGLEEGLEEGLKEGLKEGLEEGLKEGLEEGLKEGLEEGLLEGRAEGWAEADAEWEEWFERRLKAESKDEPFNEPPPSVRRAKTGSNGASSEGSSS